MSAFPARPRARELSKAEADELRRQAFDLERKIKARVQATHAAWWSLAEALYEFHELLGWMLLGYETLGEFLAQPEIGMSRRSFFRAVEMWRDLHIVRRVPARALSELEPSKVREVKPAIMRGHVKPEDALADAKELGYRDVVEKYRHQVGGQRLDASKEPERVKCPMCGSWVIDDVIEGRATELPARGGS